MRSRSNRSENLNDSDFIPLLPISDNDKFNLNAELSACITLLENKTSHTNISQQVKRGTCASTTLFMAVLLLGGCLTAVLKGIQSHDALVENIDWLNHQNEEALRLTRIANRSRNAYKFHYATLNINCEKAEFLKGYERPFCNNFELIKFAYEICKQLFREFCKDYARQEAFFHNVKDEGPNDFWSPFYLVIVGGIVAITSLLALSLLFRFTSPYLSKAYKNSDDSKNKLSSTERARMIALCQDLDIDFDETNLKLTLDQLRQLKSEMANNERNKQKHDHADRFIRLDEESQVGDEELNASMDEENDERPMSLTHLNLNIVRITQPLNPPGWRIRLPQTAKASFCEASIAFTCAAATNYFLAPNTSWLLNPFALSSLLFTGNFLLRILPERELSIHFISRNLFTTSPTQHFRNLLFTVIDNFNRAVLWHEAGHALANIMVCQNANPHIVITLGSSNQSGYTVIDDCKVPSALGAALGYSNRRIVIDAAGALATTAWSGASLLLAQVIPNHYSEIKNCLRYIALLNILVDLGYVLSPYFYGCDDNYGDFCHIQKRGMPPVVIAVFMLAVVMLAQISPVILSAFIQGCRNLKNTPTLEPRFEEIIEGEGEKEEASTSDHFCSTVENEHEFTAEEVTKNEEEITTKTLTTSTNRVISESSKLLFFKSPLQDQQSNFNPNHDKNSVLASSITLQKNAS